MYESTKIIRGILNEFSSENLEYAIIRNYDFLVNDNEQVGKDIDIVIKKENSDRFGNILKSNGFFKQPVSPYSNHSGYWRYLPKEKSFISMKEESLEAASHI